MPYTSLLHVYYDDVCPQAVRLRENNHPKVQDWNLTDSIKRRACFYKRVASVYGTFARVFGGVGDSTIKGGRWLHTVKTLLSASFKRTQRGSLLERLLLVLTIAVNKH